MTQRIIVGPFLFITAIIIYNLNIFNYFILLFNLLCLYECIKMYFNCYKPNKYSIYFNSLYLSYCSLMLFISYHVLTLTDILLFNIIAIAAISDTFQHAIGANLGKNYVSKISPTKTYEGYLAGMISVLLYGLFIQYTSLNYNLSTYQYFICYIYTIFGDFISSYFKRSLGIKDWSTSLGKVGGFFDRGNSSIGLSLYFLIFRD